LQTDDDQDNSMFIKEAFNQNFKEKEICFVNDGAELLDYPRRRNKYSESASSPSIVLLNLNMPKKDGREALKEIKSDPTLRTISVLILTTSRAKQGVLKTSDLGGNCALLPNLYLLRIFWK
jgi:CheY-like chemotaxis protein